MKKSLFNQYKKFLPITHKTPEVTLGEGFTPLVKSRNLSNKFNCEMYFKLEGCNPSSSFKDRGMFMAVSKAIENKKKKIICASTGNTSASAAAYGARYNLETFVIIPAGKIALGKLLQAMAYGAKIISIDGNFDQALKAVREISDNLGLEIVNSINPYRLEGQMTGAFEISDELDGAPDFQFMPVGNAGNISSYFKGYKKYMDAKKISKLPKLIGIQAENSAPLVDNKIIDSPSTLASAIRIGNPASSKLAKDAISVTGGKFIKVSDDEIINAQSILAKEEGLFCEPASAASLAGFFKYAESEDDYKGKTLTFILTGNGLKDPEVAKKYLSSKIIKTSSKIKDIAESIQNGKSKSFIRRFF